MHIKKLDILNESEFRENVLLLGHNHHFAENIVLKTNGAASSFVITDIGGDIMTNIIRSGISVKREISIRLLRS